MNLIALPAFTDNYIWMLHDGREALVIDPGQAQPVWDALRALSSAGLQLSAILVTHHHPDHVGGVAELVAGTGAKVWGPAGEILPFEGARCAGGQRLTWAGLDIDVLDVPGHTAGHVAYHLPRVALEQGERPVLFCGDTLFSGGCGRLFEGTPAQMLASLDQLAALPDDCLVACAHEYTLSNLRFALAVEPGNTELQAYAARCEALRGQGLFTLPSTVAIERAINPFLRSRSASVRQTLQAQFPDQAVRADSDDVAAFAALRQWKNVFQ